jgi:hypothetical protein
MSYDPDGASGESQSERKNQQSAGDAKPELGDLFADHAPAAQKLVDELSREHPDIDREGLVRLVKKHAVRKLTTASSHDDATQFLRDTVAELAVAIALLRGIEPRTSADFNELGIRIMHSAEKTATLHQRFGTAVPQAVSGFERVARHVQPLVAEQLFRALAGIKPARPGMARDAYKSARSTVWRARYNRDLSAAAAGRASAALVRAMDAAAPRLIVRMVDRSLRRKPGHRELE